VLNKIKKLPRRIVSLLRFFKGLYRSKNIITNWNKLFVLFLKNKNSNKNLQVKVLIDDKTINYIPYKDLRRVVDLYSVSIADIFYNGYKKIYNQNFTLRKDDVVIDIGAHLGRFSFPTLVKYQGIKVYAYEPDVVNFNCIKNSIERNDFSNMLVENVAVFDKEGYYNFSNGPESSQGSLTEVGFFIDTSNSKKTSVKTKTLESIFIEKDIKKCKLLKIDCEGSEYEIFHNLPDYIFKKIENIYIEIHPTDKFQPESLKLFLTNKGFEVHELTREDDCIEAICTKKINQ
jgi:FkbM family methyltransferase